MIRTKLFLVCALAFVVSLTGTTASAQEPTNQITYFTFSAPFELPGGKVLPAGKYVFKIVDSPGNRHVVQVMSEDQQTMHATLLAIPAQRQEPPSEPEVRFMEAEANAAPAVRTWWYPGRSIGHEFIYPKDQARRLAARQSEGVLTVAGDATDDEAMRSGELSRIGANGQETAETTTENTTAAAQTNTTSQQTTTAAQTSAPAPEPSTTSPASPSTPAPAAETTTATQSTSAAAQTAQTSPATSAPSSSSAQTSPSAQTAQTTPRQPAAAPAAQTTARTELPRTASALPLIALLGLGSLMGAGLLRFRR